MKRLPLTNTPWINSRVSDNTLQKIESNTRQYSRENLLTQEASACETWYTLGQGVSCFMLLAHMAN